MKDKHFLGSGLGGVGVVVRGDQLGTGDILVDNVDFLWLSVMKWLLDSAVMVNSWQVYCGG
jgi:hypothetical protein